MVIASSTMEKRPSSIFVEHLEDATPTQEDMEVCLVSWSLFDDSQVG